MKQKVQSLGGFLTAMILPNIGAFIAWGLLTAMFIPTGWFPNEFFAQLKDPILKYLLPLLVGYTGGELVYKKRGGVMGALLTMGCVVGTSITMLAGAMILGPLGGWIIKKFDKLIDGKIPSGLRDAGEQFLHRYYRYGVLPVDTVHRRTDFRGTEYILLFRCAVADG